MLREAWPDLGDVVSTAEFEKTPDAAAALAATRPGAALLAPSDIDRILGQLSPAITGMGGKIEVRAKAKRTEAMF